MAAWRPAEWKLLLLFIYSHNTERKMALMHTHSPILRWKKNEQLSRVTFLTMYTWGRLPSLITLMTSTLDLNSLLSSFVISPKFHQLVPNPSYRTYVALSPTVSIQKTRALNPLFSISIQRHFSLFLLITLTKSASLHFFQLRTFKNIAISHKENDSKCFIVI